MNPTLIEITVPLNEARLCFPAFLDLHYAHGLRINQVDQVARLTFGPFNDGQEILMLQTARVFLSGFGVAPLNQRFVGTS